MWMYNGRIQDLKHAQLFLMNIKIHLYFIELYT